MRPTCPMVYGICVAIYRIRRVAYRKCPPMYRNRLVAYRGCLSVW